MTNGPCHYQPGPDETVESCRFISVLSNDWQEGNSQKMANAGYSGTPLVRKLGLKEIHCGLFIDVPGGPLESLMEAVAVADRVTGSESVPSTGYSVVVLFVKERQLLQSWLEPLIGAIDRDGMIWVAWPKRASKVPTDITEDVVREEALPLGLVDIKVCAVDQIWSGLKLVIRKELR